MRGQIFVFLLLVTLTILCVNYDIVDVSSTVYEQVSTHISKNILSPEIEAFSQCVLPDLNPFDESIRKHVDVWKKWDSKCTDNSEYRSKLVKGKIEPIQKGQYCFGRCITRKSAFKNNYGKWLPASNTTFDCDIVEAGCTNKNDVTTVGYTDMHGQIVKKPNPKKYTGKKPYNVFMIAFDSHGMSQAYRNLPKSLSFMTKGMDAVIFPYVNKVGLNTRPNSIAMLFGKAIEPQDKSVFGLPVTPADWDWKGSCYRYLDNETAIFTEYANAGYTSFYGEDWALGVLGYPNCYGFLKQEADHTFQPFMVETLSKSWKKSHPKTNCGSRKPEELYAQAQKFLDAYPDEPKFSWMWSNDVSHDYESGSIPFDTNLYSFLWKNKETFENSFVILLSDHGLRFGSVSKTPLGSLDNNNPMFIMSVPKELRKSGILETMRTNAKNLQTHYDSRATILDIVRYQPLEDFKDRENMQIPGEKGNSYFREQIGERSCRSLPIPFQYCICQHKLETVKPTDSEAVQLGKAVIDSINKLITSRNATSTCPLWTYSKTVAVTAYAPKDNTHTFNVQVATSKPYNKAVFRTLVIRKGPKEFNVGKVDRVDSYGKRGDCNKTDIQPLCDCVSPSETDSTTTTQATTTKTTTTSSSSTSSTSSMKAQVSTTGITKST